MSATDPRRPWHRLQWGVALLLLALLVVVVVVDPTGPRVAPIEHPDVRPATAAPIAKEAVVAPVKTAEVAAPIAPSPSPRPRRRRARGASASTKPAPAATPRALPPPPLPGRDPVVEMDEDVVMIAPKAKIKPFNVIPKRWRGATTKLRQAGDHL